VTPCSIDIFHVLAEFFQIGKFVQE
jgi:hypothetical protein